MFYLANEINSLKNYVDRKKNKKKIKIINLIQRKLLMNFQVFLN